MSSAPERCEAAVETCRAGSSAVLLQLSEVASHQAFQERVDMTRAAKAGLGQSSSQKSAAASRGGREDMASEGVQGVKAWTVEDTVETLGERHHAAPQISLMMAGGARKHRPKERSESHDEEEGEEEEEEGEEKEEEEDDEEEEALGSDDDVDESDEERREKRRKHNFAKSSADTRSQQVLKKKRKQTSLAALSEIMEADRQTLDEEGYSAVTSTVSNRMMERFVERTIADLNLEVVDTGGLKGLVPYYSGQKDIQTFEALQDELLDTADQPESWLLKKSKRPEQSNLLQLGAQVGVAEERKHHVDQRVSFLEQASGRVRRAAHRVPDLANYFFGSQTVVMLCMVGFVAALFCLHEHNEKKRVAKGLLFEDPLNMSPTPPAPKQDHMLAANLKALRSQKTVQ